MRYAIVGRGRLGAGLGGALRAAGAHVQATPGRHAHAISEDVDVVVLAVPDPAIEAVAAAVPAREGRVVLHCSGSLDAGVLAPLAERGVMHPLVSFADPAQPPRLTDTVFFVAGTSSAVAAARQLAHQVGARAVEASIHGPAYHAVAALSANGAAALATIAVRVLGRLGVERRDAEAAIGALLSTVGENVARVGVPDALSGPVIRGDHRAVARHRAALRGFDDDALGAYDAVAEPILMCAREAGLSEERADAVRRAMSESAEQATSRRAAQPSD